MRDRANWLVLAQFLLLALLLLPGDPMWSAPWITVLAALLVIDGIVLAVAGFAALGRDLVVWVAPKEGATLRTTGVYRLTRNPIYLGLIVGTAGWVLWRGRFELIVVWLLLVTVLVVKARVEQHRLVDAFGDEYREYAAQTPLLLFRRGIR
ncbi:protein-S-isoprenylcysteine O-methyltransferase Ste14 [Agromyces ramosus]|uniref:Protein-S-isoprenylcysteine O-methyltransferase Ste14 n=1 Tax=Agromyces ramosus TaxID=33879 RepID=A0A4V2EYX4_9MICO|nr:isoprenylcysteine carboxylmethyltransferase family protein [Agromyces ramosus]RZS64500.1 protein-S-isoprenylcysteine O-methyltransferase Ste14 [Agromyces ramosus]